MSLPPKTKTFQQLLNSLGAVQRAYPDMDPIEQARLAGFPVDEIENVSTLSSIAAPNGDLIDGDAPGEGLDCVARDQVARAQWIAGRMKAGLSIPPQRDLFAEAEDSGYFGPDDNVTRH